MEPLIFKAKSSHNSDYLEDYRIVCFDENENVVGYVNYLKGNANIADTIYYDQPKDFDKEFVGYVKNSTPDLSSLFDVIEDNTCIGEEEMKEFVNHYNNLTRH